jgi:hypothetical protein
VGSGFAMPNTSSTLWMACSSLEECIGVRKSGYILPQGQRSQPGLQNTPLRLLNRRSQGSWNRDLLMLLSERLADHLRCNGKIKLNKVSAISFQSTASKDSARTSTCGYYQETDPPNNADQLFSDVSFASFILESVQSSTACDSLSAYLAVSSGDPSEMWP